MIENIDLDKLIEVSQLPKITEQLSIISTKIDSEIEKALSLEPTKDNKKYIKDARANLNNIKESLEERRKFIKNEILKPYREFESVYKPLVTDRMNNADKVLKERIDDIENTEKNKKKNELLDFIDQYLEFYNLKGVLTSIMFLPNVTLSQSEKSLKEQVKEQIERVAREMECIKQEENASETLMYYIEYGFDYAKAKLQVIENHKKIDSVSNWTTNTDIIEPIKEQEEEFVSPIEVEEQEEIECTFTIFATKQQLIQIRNYLKEMGVKYE